jgi:hypothetical protein
VSIAALTSGMFKVISLVKRAERSTLEGRTSDFAGASRTSSKVKAGLILSGFI